MSNTAAVLVGCLMVLVLLATATVSAPTAIPPSGIDSLFETGDEKAVGDAIAGSDTFKRAVAEAVKVREARKAEIKGDPKKSVGISPAQAARVRFTEVLNGK